MLPKLSRFYGGTPTEWLHCPLPLLRAYSAMLPRLQAEETLRQVFVARASQPQSKQGQRAASRALRKLERQASGRVKAPPPSRQALVAAGIGVEGGQDG